MRRSLVLGGWGLAGVLAAGPAATGQFAVDRTAPVNAPRPQAAQPQPPAGTEPAPPPALPTGPVTRAAVTTPAAAPEQPESPPSPWAVRPEHGEWLICVKSYTGPQARQLAEEMAGEVRATRKVAAYLYEWGGEQRRKEEQKRQLLRQVQQQREAPFLELREQMRKKAEEEGRDFDVTPPTIRIPKTEYTEQWAVLLGGNFKDMDTASKALAAVRRWPAPEGKPHLLEQAAVAAAGAKEIDNTYLNPYANALVVRNPTARKAAADQPAIDPGLKRWNEKEEFSLLKCKKGYTLLVKQFSVPIKTQTKDADPGMFDQLFRGSKGAEYLQATAQQAHALAKALRDPKMAEARRAKGLPPIPESYVLHVRTGSLVTVGEFDDRDDPELVRLQQVLSSMTFNVQDEHRRPVGPTGVDKMFDSVYPMAIPKVD